MKKGVPLGFLVLMGSQEKLWGRKGRESTNAFLIFEGKLIRRSATVVGGKFQEGNGGRRSQTKDLSILLKGGGSKETKKD